MHACMPHSDRTQQTDVCKRSVDWQPPRVFPIFVQAAFRRTVDPEAACRNRKMSVSSPLIRELKGWTRKLTEYGQEIEDDNPDLPQFCRSLEKCFQKGVLIRFNTIGFPKVPDAWHWLEEVACKNLSSCCTFSLALAQVQQNPKVQTATGKLRLLIRTCLVRKCLHTPVEFLVRTGESLQFYAPGSILGDGILGEIFLSVVLQLSRLMFKLNLRNANFLDETWQLPDCVALELVPCKNLGVSMCFTKGKALIVALDKSSVAAEDDKVEVGDILDEINGIPITSGTKGKLRKIMKKAVGQPVSLHVIKHQYGGTDEIYGPIASLMKSSGVESLRKLLESAKKCDSKQLEHEPRDLDSSLNAGFSVKFCGSLPIGSKGDVGQIERAILQLLRSGDSAPQPVKFECLEIGIRVTDSSGNVICRQSYMEISCCGRTANVPDYFAFIAGEANCNLASKFDAYVFYHLDEAEVQTILQSLGQGFQRTHFAV